MQYHSFLCQSCNQEISVPPAAIGKSATCPCGAIIVVPTTEDDLAYRKKAISKRHLAKARRRDSRRQKRAENQAETQRAKQLSQIDRANRQVTRARQQEERIQQIITRKPQSSSTSALIFGILALATCWTILGGLGFGFVGLLYDTGRRGCTRSSLATAGFVCNSVAVALTAILMIIYISAVGAWGLVAAAIFGS